MWPGMSAGKHSISTSRSICSRMPPCTFTPGASPFSMIGTLTRSTLSMAMRFRSTCSSAPLMGSYCQSTIITLAASAVEREIENGVVARLGMQDAVHLLGIDGDGLRVLPRAVHHGGNHAGLAQAAGVILAAALPRLGFYVLSLQLL